jgi:hypothetical protein
MFRLTSTEAEELNRSQFATGSQKHRTPRSLPYAFTEHGIAMLSAVLNSERAVQMSIPIVRAFVKLREVLASHRDLARKSTSSEPRKKTTRPSLASSSMTFRTWESMWQTNSKT